MIWLAVTRRSLHHVGDGGGGGEFCTQAIKKSPQPELVNLVFFRQTEVCCNKHKAIRPGLENVS